MAPCKPAKWSETVAAEQEVKRLRDVIDYGTNAIHAAAAVSGGDLELVGELTATFVVAAKMEDEGIEPDSRVADGIRAVLNVLAHKRGYEP